MASDALPPWNVPPAGHGAGPDPVPPLVAKPVLPPPTERPAAGAAPQPGATGATGGGATPGGTTGAASGVPGLGAPNSGASGASGLGAPGAGPPAAIPLRRVAARQVAMQAIPLGPTLPGAASRKSPTEPAIPGRRPQRDPFRGRRKFWAAFSASTLFHVVLVLVAGMIAAGNPTKVEPRTLVASTGVVRPPPLEKLQVPRAVIPQAPRAKIQVETPNQTASRIVRDAVGQFGEARRSAPSKTLTFTPGSMGIGEMLSEVGGSPYGMLDGRDGPLKAQLLADATPDSEQAVYRGLKWLAAHQREDGGWNFDHRQTGCNYCPNPGTHGSMAAATGLCLLPFLGAGHTHMKQGEFQETVRKGLEFLKRRVKQTPLGGDLQDGVNLYSQAIATLALCEAYAMTRDRELQSSCVEAVRFIVNSQHKPGGGWRYFPGQVGDTTVTGWMLMALKSAQLGYVSVPADVWPNAKHFLDTVQDDGGAAYGYQSPEKDRSTMTAIGLLCRMYGGWPRSQDALGRGIRAVGRKGPSKSDLYFDYYATQALRHYGGTDWHAWNSSMRDFLVESQESRGHMSGSWYFQDQHGDQGGRVYNTAMAILILEVYYRHLPIYGFRAVGDDFKGK